METEDSHDETWVISSNQTQQKVMEQTSRREDRVMRKMQWTLGGHLKKELLGGIDISVNN